jgi:UrcA family protein
VPLQIQQRRNAMIRSILMPAAAALAIAIVAAPAAAQSVRHVSYGDLDLSNSAGRKMLRDRVSTAVNHVCGRTEPRNVYSLGEVESCRRETWATTEPQLNAVLGRPTVEILAHARIVVGKARTAAY